MTPEEFKRQLLELRKIILDGVAYYWAWRGLIVEDKESLTALNRYRAFFYPVRVSLRKMALMEFSKVFDRDHRAVSLTNLLAKAKEDRQNLMPCATDGELDQLDTQVKENEPLIKSLMRLRNQRLAHHDAFRLTDGRKERLGDVQKLMEEIVSMFNALSSGHDGNATWDVWLKSNGEWHTSEVVRIMREEIERVIQKREREILKLSDIEGSW
jgi:hypothetical protein